jgi:hypothetical protein
MTSVVDIDTRRRSKVGTWEIELAADYDQYYDEQASSWLVDEILHESVTVMASPPKAGKSALAVGLIAALSNGAPEYLGQAVRGHGSTLIFHTDAGSRREYHARLRAHGANLSKVGYIDGRRMMDTNEQGWLALVEVWASRLADLRLVVIDNVLGVLGDIAPGERLNNFWMRAQDFNSYGAATLVLHHTAVADETGYGKGRRPQGGRSNETNARQIVMLLPPGGNAPRAVLKMEATGNDMPEGGIVRYVELRDLDGSPSVVPSDWRPSNRSGEERSSQRLDKGARIAELAKLYPDATSRNKLAELMYKDHGKELHLAQLTIRDKLRQMELPQVK